jgi:glycosyltransferase involved in cell wall biosynthesis
VRLESLFSHRARHLPALLAQRVGALGRLRKALRRHRPDVLYSFLYVANALAARAVRGARAGDLSTLPLVWGLRASNPRLGLKELPAFQLCRRFSRRVNLIIANSRAGVAYHRGRGFRPPRFAVVANGLDTDAFQPRIEAAATVRELWGVEAEAPLMAVVARLHPMKDHENFLRAGARVAEELPALGMVCVGTGPAKLEERLRAVARELEIEDRVIWAGEQESMAPVYSAVDLLVSSSAYGEGFSNVVAEAMACEVPCVVTDVGDSALLVGGTGTVVAPEDSQALAAAITALLKLPAEKRREAGRAGRQRVLEQFSADTAVETTEELLRSVQGPPPEAAP